MLPDAEGQAAEAGTDITGDGDTVLTGQLNPPVVPPSLGGRQVLVQTALSGQGVAVQSVGLWARKGLGQAPQGTRVWTQREAGKVSRRPSHPAHAGSPSGWGRGQGWCGSAPWSAT